MSLTTTHEKSAFYVPPLRPGASCDAAASGTEIAVVRVTDEQGHVLDLCSHHFTQHEAELWLSGWTVARDNRGQAR